jgi:putative peptidoglycan lipid II flippase
MLRNVLTLSSGSLFGKISGLIREILFAAFFGTSAAADAYRAAMTATLVPVHLFTSEALNAAFIPQFRTDRDNKDNSAWTLLNGIGLALIIISLFIGCILYFFAQTWVSLVFPGFMEDQADLAVRMLQIMAWGVPLYVLSAILISLEIACGHFRLAAWRPLIQNLGIITAISIAFLGKSPVHIAWGFTGTYIIFSLFGTVSLIRKNIFKSNWHSYWTNITEVSGRFWDSMKPLVLFSVLLQCNILIEKAVASLIGPGAVAAVDYARMIPETTQMLLIVPLGTVSLSSLVSFQEEEVRKHCDRISAAVLLLLVPVSSFTLISAPDIIKVIYGRGAFDANSISLTFHLLRGMSVGMWAVSLAYVFQKIFNARIRNREVLRIGATGVLANALFNILAYKYLGVLAIGLGFSLGGIISLWLYIRHIGPLKKITRTGRICLIGLLPHCIIGFLIKNSYNWTPFTGLLVQLLWAAISWGIIFWVFPASRNTLLYLCEKLISLRPVNR